MNREIKFRAWDGDKLITDNSVKFFVEFDGTVWFNDGVTEYDMLIEQPHFILMQYTGLKDKNGKEIYEGDIISNPFNSDKNVIKYDWFAPDENFPQCKILGFCATEEFGLGLDINGIVSIEVIGNIYEHEYLLNERI